MQVKPKAQRRANKGNTKRLHFQAENKLKLQEGQCFPSR